MSKVAVNDNILSVRRTALRMTREGKPGRAISILLRCLVEHPGALGLAKQLRDLSIETQSVERTLLLARLSRVVAPGNSEFLIPWGAADLGKRAPGQAADLLQRFWASAAEDESQQVRAGVALRRLGETERLEGLLSRMIARRCAILARDGRPAVQAYLGFIDGLYNYFWGSRVAADKIAALELMERTATPALMNIPDAMASDITSRYRNA